MTRFRFGLEKVLRLRKSELNQVKIEFQAAMDAVHRIEEVIARFRQDMEQARLELRDEQDKPRIQVRRLLVIEAGLGQLDRALKQAEQQKTQALEYVEGIRVRLQEAERRAKSLKRIKARNKARFDAAEKAEDMKRLDEIAVTRYVRNRSNG